MALTMSEDFDSWLEQAAEVAGAAEVLESKAIARLRARLNKAKRLLKSTQRERDQFAERVETLVELSSAPATPALVIPRQTKSKARAVGVPVMMWSDWHVEEVVDPDTVNGRNEYNPAISLQRSRHLAEGCAWMIQQLGGWDIERGVVWLGGDLITGYIHDELIEANAKSPTQAVLQAQQQITEALIYVLDNSCLERIDVVCSFGNHGRTTQRRRVQTAAANSYEWLMYHVLAQRFDGDDRFNFIIADGAQVYTEVLGKTIRWHHGDDVRYQGGVGGISIPMRKAATAWDTFMPADITVVGHWHQFKDFGDVVVNGSLIGYNAFALSIKARYEVPRQGFFLIDNDHGKRLVTPIHVDAKQR
jgi:hypothetical protein